MYLCVCVRVPSVSAEAIATRQILLNLREFGIYTMYTHLPFLVSLAEGKGWHIRRSWQFLLPRVQVVAGGISSAEQAFLDRVPWILSVTVSSQCREL